MLFWLVGRLETTQISIEEDDWNRRVTEACTKIDEQKTLPRFRQKQQRSNIEVLRELLELCSREPHNVSSLIGHLNTNYKASKSLVVCCMAANLLETDEPRSYITSENGIRLLAELNDLRRMIPWTFYGSTPRFNQRLEAPGLKVQLAD